MSSGAPWAPSEDGSPGGDSARTTPTPARMAAAAAERQPSGPEWCGCSGQSSQARCLTQAREPTAVELCADRAAFPREWSSQAPSNNLGRKGTKTGRMDY